MRYLKEFNIFDQVKEWLPKPDTIEEITKGDRVKIEEMPEDPDPIPKGTEGTVESIASGVQVLHIDWDNKRSLSLLFDADNFLWQPIS